MTAPIKWTEAMVLDTIRDAYLPPAFAPENHEWAMLTQVALPAPGGGERVLDALLVRTLAGEYGHDRLAVEVKVSVADYRNETDAKRVPAETYAHRCAYAAPAGLLTPESLPARWGLIEVYPTPQEAQADIRGALWTGARLVWRKPAPMVAPTPELDPLVAAGFRRAGRAEDRIRAGDCTAAEVAALREAVRRLEGKAARAETTKRRERQRAKAARSLMLAMEGMQECADCGGPVTYKPTGDPGGQLRWTHTDPATERRCARTRKEADRRRREASHGTAYAWGFAGDVEPVALRAYLAADDEVPDTG